MDHDDARQRLPELLGLRSVPGDEPALSAHIDGCAACRDELAALARVDRALREAGAAEPGPALDERVLAIPAGTERRPAHASRRAWIAAAASLLLAIVTSAAWLGGRDPAPPAFTASRTVDLADAGTGVRARLEFGRSDGQNQPIRLVAHGLSTAGARYYVLWLTGPGGRVSAATFRPDPDGDCVVVGVAPADATWTHVGIAAAHAPRVDLAGGPL